MGLFDVFKKKKAEPQITWETTIKTSENYDPWAKTSGTRNDNYAIAAFIRISEGGAKVGNTNDDYARYFNYEFHVYDPIKYHKKVISEGYLVDASPNIALKKLKVAELKVILSNAGFSDKGRKDDLIARIIDNIDISSLNLEKYYVPSEKGLEHLKQFEYVFQLKNYGISWEEFDIFKEVYPTLKANDIIWRILTKRFNEESTDGNFGLARNELFNMAKLLEHEGKCIDALSFYSLVLYYDTSGCGNKRIEKLDEIKLAPGVIECIHRLKDNYDEQIIIRCYDRYRLPYHYINKENFKKLLFDIFDDKSIDIKNYI